jgi:hypothetical protein
LSFLDKPISMQQTVVASIWRGGDKGYLLLLAVL